jgi:hypothetical protein
MPEIICKNIRRIEAVEFGDYKLIKRFNFSYLKRERAGIATDLQMNDKIMLGTLVDAILTGGYVDMGHRMYRHAKKIAAYIKTNFGALLPHLSTQVTYIGEMHYRGFVLPVKGRLDWELPKRMVIDLKVTSAADIHGLIDHMRYADQQFCYYTLAQAPESYILAYSTKLEKAMVVPIEVTKYNEFWAEKILRFGSVA